MAESKFTRFLGRVGFTIAFCVISFLALMLVRVEMVSYYRGEILKEISFAIKADLKAGREDWEWRYDAFETVTFDQMMFQWWRKPSSFYSDHSFHRQ